MAEPAQRDAVPSPSEVLPESRNPFAARLFSTWWAASLIAGTGVGIQAVTVPLFIRDRVDLEVRAIAIAGALIAQTLPGALLVLLGGALADRIERRLILLRTYGLVSVVSLGYVALCGFDVRAIWPVFPLAAIVGSAAAFTNPARQSMLPQIVTRAQLQNGVIFGTMGFVAMLQFLGPTIGGLLVDAHGLTIAFAAEAGLLVAAAATFGRVRVTVPPPPSTSVLADLVAGVRAVAQQPAIRGLLLLGMVPGIFFIGPFAVTTPLIVPDVFHASDKWVGILSGCFGAGVVAGSLALTFRPIPRRGLAVCASTLSGGIVLFAYGFSETLLVSAGLLVVWGLGASIFINYVVALLQEHAEPEMLGRVMSMYSLSFFLAMPLGYAQAGLLTRTFDIQTTLVANGCIAIVIGAASLVWLHSVRALR